MDRRFHKFENRVAGTVFSNFTVDLKTVREDDKVDSQIRTSVDNNTTTVRNISQEILR